jgi:rare lipoprotein A
MFSTLLNFAQTEFGVASYYGIDFEGRPTASGEIYSQNKLTAAHKTLPLGTILKVTNAQNNKSVYVKVNDRGPFVKGRILDLSTKAAEILGYRNKGTCYVKMEIVQPDQIPDNLLAASKDIAKENGIGNDSISSDTVSSLNAFPANKPTTPNNGKTTASNTPTNMPQPAVEIKEANQYGIKNRSAYFVITNLDKNKLGFYGLQLGVFSDPSVIFPMIAELESLYHENVAIQQAEVDGKIVYKLLVGKFQNRAYADALKLQVSQKYKDAFVVKYE